MLHEFPLCPPLPQGGVGMANCQLSLSFGQEVDREIWKAAWEVLLLRHPILRTVLSNGGKSLLEYDQLEPFWNEPDWSNLETSELPARWKELQETEAETAFRPGTSPFWRLYFLKLPGGQSHLLWTVHPLLLDESSAAQILVEWFELYGRGSETGEPIVATASPSAALGAAELPEDYPAVAEAMEGLPRFGAHPFLVESGGEKSQRVESVEIPAAAWEALVDFAREEGVGPSAVVTALWAGLLASWNGSGQSLVGAMVDLRPFLPAESSDLRGRFLCQVPFRLSSPPASPYRNWLGQTARTVENLASGAFTEWVEAADAMALRWALPLLPVSTVAWQSLECNHALHTAFPRWLSADARWSAPQPSPVVLRVSGEKRVVLSLEYLPGFFPEGLARLALTSLVALLNNLPELGNWASVRQEAIAGAANVPASDPGLRLTELLRAGVGGVRWGEEFLSGAQCLTESNQWLRFFRKNRPGSESRLLLSLEPGLDLVRALLALIRDRTDFLCVGPEQWEKMTAAQLAELRVGIVLADRAPLHDESSSQDEIHEQENQNGEPKPARPRLLLLADVRERIYQQPDGLPGERKSVEAARWGFLQPDGRELVLEESELGAAWSNLEGWWEVGAEDCLAWPLTLLQPRHLVELLCFLGGGGTILLPERELFSSRSDFEEFLHRHEVTHLSLAAGRWVDWMHYNAEVRQALPASLKHILLEAGTWSAQPVRRWQEIAPTVATSLWFSPFGLPGLGLRCTLAGSDLAETGLFYLGRPDPGIKVKLTNAQGEAVPHGLPGRCEIEWSCPASENTLFELTPEVTTTSAPPGFLALAGEGGGIAALESTEGATNLDWPVYQSLTRALLEIPDILDAFLREDDTTPGSVQAWLILRDRRHPGLPASLAAGASAAISRSGWVLGGVALVPRFPLDATGRLELSSLPELQAIEALPLAKVEPELPARSSTPPIVPTPSLGNLEWLDETGDGSGSALILWGKGTEDALGKELSKSPASWRVGLLPRTGVVTAGALEGLAALLAGGGEFYLIARGRDVWDVVRLANRLEKSGNLPAGLILLDPAAPDEEPTAGLTLRLKSALRMFSGKQTNARREVSSPVRMVPCGIASRVLFSEGKALNLDQWLLEAEYFEADLSTPDQTAAAVWALLAPPVEEEPAAERAD